MTTTLKDIGRDNFADEFGDDEPLTRSSIKKWYWCNAILALENDCIEVDEVRSWLSSNCLPPHIYRVVRYEHETSTPDNRVYYAHTINLSHRKDIAQIEKHFSVREVEQGEKVIRPRLMKLKIKVPKPPRTVEQRSEAARKAHETRRANGWQHPSKANPKPPGAPKDPKRVAAAHRAWETMRARGGKKVQVGT